MDSRSRGNIYRMRLPNIFISRSLPVRRLRCDVTTQLLTRLTGHSLSFYCVPRSSFNYALFLSLFFICLYLCRQTSTALLTTGRTQKKD